MQVSINPGTGAVPQATEQHATDNMVAFLADLRERGLPLNRFTRAADQDYGEGRYAFRVYCADGTHVDVQMPGLPLDQVRWLKSEGQDIWQFPRLYVDDSSWIWYFALDQFDDEDGVRRWPNGTVRGGEEIVFGSSA